ncbi:hypothetical protein Hanom_Chr12g01071291 [Helianthus anomalus]
MMECIPTIAVLLVCDHVGPVKDGFGHFESMANFGIEPRLEYYACIVTAPVLGLTRSRSRGTENPWYWYLQRKSLTGSF